jgi:hypothetical protein|tara:strand:+ start:10742 stop:11002 length:261 start_codon:yes stop_codon:yes gene_type:complete
MNYKEDLRYSGIEVGTIIKAMDFRSMLAEGYPDQFVIGEIKETIFDHGTWFYVIDCQEDTANSRVGGEVYVPLEMMLDFDNRVTVV